MTGTLYLGGGGSQHDEQALWRAALAGSTRVLYWPFALPTSMHSGAATWFADGLALHQFAGTFEIWTTLDEHDHSELGKFDVLFVGGGNTFKLLHDIRTHGFLESVRQFVQDGGAYYGGSAGAVLACDDISIAEGLDPNDVGLSDLCSLGLVHRVAVLPHYETAQRTAATEWTLSHHTRLVGLPERTGLIVKSTTMLVVGSEPAWTFDGSHAHPHQPGTAIDADER